MIGEKGILKTIKIGLLKPGKTYQYLSRRYSLFKYNRKSRERKISYGKEHSDKVFYILRCNWGMGGLFFVLNTVLVQIRYAVALNYIPVINLRDYKNQFIEENALGKENAWEYFFEQPMNFTLDAIKRSKNIVLSALDYPYENYSVFETNFFENVSELLFFRNLFKTYIKYNKVTEDYLIADYDRILRNKGRVLGVLCRGTDYLLKKPVGHHVQPNPDDVIKKAQEVMAEKNCGYIYLATEDQNIYNLFKSSFQSKLLVNGQTRTLQKDLDDVQFLHEINRARDRDKYWLALEYLSSINLLSKCTCFIGGRTGGSIGAYIMSEGFEYDYIWEIGRYS